jgi:sarcosine oxidase subunit beta
VRDVADVVVIGAGVMGASVAYHLARAGVQRVIVVEKRFLAAGATGKSAGLVRMHYDNEPESTLAWISFDYFRNWPEVVGGHCDFRRTGFLRLVPAEFEDSLQANVAMQQRIGINMRVISGEDVSEIVPSYCTDDFDIAVYEPDSGYADPTSTTSALIDGARQMGARLFQETTVTGIRAKSGRISEVETDRGMISTCIVVNTAGAWAAEIGAMVGVELPVQGWRDELLYLQRPPDLAGSHPAVVDDINGQYFRPETGQLMLVGPWGLGEEEEIGVDPDNYREWVDDRFILGMSQRLVRRIPGMSNGAVVRGEAGCDGLSPDKHSIIDQVGPEGFYVAVGHSGTGFKIAPAVGACLAELITKGRTETMDITPFRLSRYAEGKPLVGEHPYGGGIWNQ